jgi:HAD superfamily hydrolase (TIGR01509 family)
MEDQPQVTAELTRADSAFDLLICDCDGVIIDSEVIADRVLSDLLRETYPDRDFTGLLANSFGLKTRTILERLASHLGEPLPADFLERMRTTLWQALDRDARPVSGVREALMRVDLPVAVASNSSEAWIGTALERAGLSARVAGRIFSADRVAEPKPAPDVYLLAAESLGVAPARCLVVEDSETGVAAARAAGMAVIGFTGASHIPYDHGARLTALGVRQVLDRMAALPATVALLRLAGTVEQE